MMDMALWREYLKMLDNLGATLENRTENNRPNTPP